MDRLDTLAGCATAPASQDGGTPIEVPTAETIRQARLSEYLATADRNILSAQLEPEGRFSYQYFERVGSGLEREKFVACMQRLAPAHPTVRQKGHQASYRPSELGDGSVHQGGAGRAEPTDHGEKEAAH